MADINIYKQMQYVLPFYEINKLANSNFIKTN